MGDLGDLSDLGNLGHMEEQNLNRPDHLDYHDKLGDQCYWKVVLCGDDKNKDNDEEIDDDDIKRQM